MALNPTALGAALKADFVAVGAADNAATLDLCNRIASTICAHLVDNALVTLQAGTTANGVTTGGASVPVTGTGRIA